MSDDRKILDLKEIADRFTIDGKPIYSDIKEDPDTGLLRVDITPEVKAKLEEKAEAVHKMQSDILNGKGPDVEKAMSAYKQAQQQTESVRASINAVINNLLTEETRAKLRDIADNLQPIYDALDEIEILQPYLDDELTKEEYNGATLDAMLNEITPRDLLQLPEDSLLYKALQAARTARADDLGEVLPRVRYNKGTDLKASTDKLTNLFFSLAAPKSKHNGQREMLPVPREELTQLKYERNDAKTPITLFYDFYYDEKMLKKLGIGSRFDSYDYFIAQIFDNLLLTGNSTVSLSKVWKELGNTGSPNTAQLTELYKRAVRGATTTLNLDDSEVQTAWGNIGENDTYSEIISPVMPLQIKGEKFIANGNVAKAEIRILSLSPFFALSQSIGHFTTWKKEILQLYSGRKTSRYYTVLHYLMSQIAWIRNPHSNRSNKITYKELYEYNADKSTRAKQLTRDMAYRLLDEVFKPTGYVISYKEDSKGEPGIVIKCSKNAAALPNSRKK